MARLVSTVVILMYTTLAAHADLRDLLMRGFGGASEW